MLITKEGGQEDTRRSTQRIPHPVAPSTPVSNAGRAVSAFCFHLLNFTYNLQVECQGSQHLL